MNGELEAQRRRQSAAQPAAVLQPQSQFEQQAQPAQDGRDREQAQHAAAMQAAFQRSQASSYAQVRQWRAAGCLPAASLHPSASGPNCLGWGGVGLGWSEWRSQGTVLRR